MLKRISKTIFIICLCLILLPNTYAGSVQVSDGSAFVSKSEMSYSLNNLSNRMLQLENILDSRIDQLVSSYLTRNGIWNGVKQTIEKNKIIDYWLTLSGSLSSLTADFSGDLKTTKLTQGENYDMRNNVWTLIDSCSKSGMLIGKWQVISGYENAILDNPSIGTDKRSLSFKQDSTSYNIPKVTNTSECSLYINNICLFKSVQSSIGYMRSNNSDAALYIMPKIGVENPVIFVNKGDRVMIDYKLSIIPQSDDACSAWGNKTYSHAGSCPGIVILVDDFYIY